MPKKPTYEELEQRIKDLEEESVNRKQADAALKTTFESSMDAIILFDQEKGYIDCNPAALKMFAVSSKKEFCLLTPADLSPKYQPDGSLSADLAKKELEKVFEERVHYFEWIHRGIDGREFPATVFVTRMELEGRTIFQGTIRDITGRKQVEEALRESESTLRRWLETSFTGVLFSDYEGNIEECNDTFLDIIGYTRDDLESKRLDWRKLTPPEWLHLDEIGAQELVEKGRLTPFEKEYIHKNGYRVPILLGGAVREDDPRKYIIHIVDLTQSKKVEEALQKAHDELEQRVEKRTIELELKTKSLEELNTAMKVLLKKREEDKTEVEQNVMTNVRELITPYFDKINETKLDDHQKAFLNILESNLNEIVSPFTRKLSLKYLNLTPKEIQIVNMIKIGYQSKKIAKIMKISPRTVDTHRKNIRSKIGLGQKRANLRSHILAHEQ